MAAVVPITSRVDGQVSLLATTVVTASGGGAKLEPCALNIWNCRYLKKPRPATTRITTASMKNIRLAMISL